MVRNDRLSLSNVNGGFCSPAAAIIGDGDHSLACVQIQSSFRPVFSHGNFLAVDGDGHILTNGHTLHSGKQLTQGKRIAIGSRNIFNSFKLILGEDVFLRPAVCIACELLEHITNSLDLIQGIGGAVIAQIGVYRFHSLTQSCAVIRTGDGQFLTLHRKGNDGIALDGGGSAQLIACLVLAENVLQAQGQHILLDRTGLHIGLCLQVVNTQAVAVAGDQGIDHFVSLKGGLIAQRHAAGYQADAGDTGVEAVGGVNAIFFYNQVRLDLTGGLGNLLDRTVDGTAQATALACIVIIVS